MDQRFKALQEWLEKELGWSLIDLRTASNDASFRRYFRAIIEKSGETSRERSREPSADHSSFVIMDAPPQQERLEPFISIARALKKQGVNSPQVHEINQQQGYLVLQDLGDITYLQSLLEQNSEPHSDALYQDAIKSLILLQQGTWQADSFKLPNYDARLLEQELDLFTQWYLREHLRHSLDTNQLEVWQRTKQLLISACEEQPQVWVHRDYHSRNLMLTTESSPGVIDFQDMVIGPISYDLASLLKDCYIQWPRDRQLSWLKDYYRLMTQSFNQLEKGFSQMEFSFEQLIRWDDLTGMQRHLKVLGIFSRLNYRDGKNQYLGDLPLVKQYVDEVLSLYPEFSDFRSLFDQVHNKVACD